MAQFERAERLATAAGDEPLLADAWERRGQLLLQLDRADEALALVAAAAEKRRGFAHGVGLAVDLTSKGRALLALGRLAAARQAYEEALELFVQLDVPRWAPAARLGLARVARAEGRSDAALALIEQTLSEHRRQANEAGIAEALSEEASILRDAGSLEAAAAVAEEAAALYEGLRAGTASLAMRSTYFATVVRHFELYVDLLMDLHARQPEAGYDVQALAVSERARARSLLDQLAESAQRIRSAADPALVAEESEWQTRIALLERQRLERLSAVQPDAAALSAIDGEVRDAIAALESVRRRLRASGLNALGAYTGRPALRLADIREHVLDPATVLLEYELGEERSYLWAVTSDGFRSATLPGRATLAGLVNRAVRGLETSHHREGAAATSALLCQLGSQLLGPVADLLPGRRLAIVADESLHQLPFAVLPEPAGVDCREQQPLIVLHEVVSLPSASALAGQRVRSAARTERSRRRVAVLADPVFDSMDHRAPGSAPRPRRRRTGKARTSCARATR